jgi:hypothetical protein
VAESNGFCVVCLSDPNGGVYTTTNRQAPATPTSLRVTRVGNDFIDLAWDDESDNEEGFRVTYEGRRQGESDDKGTKTVDANATSTSLSGLLSGYEYNITVAAFNVVGTSSGSNVVGATTTDTPHDVTVTLVRQQVVEGPVEYEGQYPAGGSVQPGRVLSISVPPSSEVVAIRFVTDSSELVEVPQGTTTTTEQMKRIFNGTAEPAYATGHPVLLRALIAQSDDTLLEEVQIMLTIVAD